MSNKISFIGTPSRPTLRETNSLPYVGLSKNLPAKLQFVYTLIFGWSNLCTLWARAATSSADLPEAMIRKHTWASQSTQTA